MLYTYPTGYPARFPLQSAVLRTYRTRLLLTDLRPTFSSRRINTPSLAHAAKHARTLSRGALGRPPPCVHAPDRDTHSR
eukprot:6172496-Pleurochrysis_carterae.AAC.1